MQILLENGSHSLDNLGDIAMLQMAAQRVADLWPGSSVKAVTIEPKRLEQHLPGVDPAAPASLPAWSLPLAQAGSNLPNGLRETLAGVLAKARRGFGVSRLPVRRQEELKAVDLVLMAGSGIFADPFQGPALRRLETLAAAQRSGVPFALMSQGLGPISERSLRDRASDAFSGASLIALRERLHGPDLLKRMGVPDDRVMIAGDDSLELALGNHRSDGPREALGFNLRLAPYSGLSTSSTSELAQIVETLQEFAQAQGAAFQPLSVHRSDHARLLRAFPELRHVELGPKHQHAVEELLQALSYCRVVVAGSYHAALLALGQGIPALCLAKNRYYRLKFNGLADQFPQGCAPIDLAQAGAAAQAERRLEDLWHRAHELRDPLLAAAGSQVEQCRATYQRLRNMV